MRLKTFTADSMSEAMHLVKTQLGENAVILSTQEDVDSNRIHVTAAIDDMLEEISSSNAPGEQSRLSLIEELTPILDRHGIPMVLRNRILEGVTPQVSASEALTDALDQIYIFNPLALRKERPIMLVGVPGVGKTVTVAKLATSATLKKKNVFLMTTDTEKTGAIDQLSGFSDVLKVPLHVGHTPELLQDEMAKAPPGSHIIIDSAGINPFNANEVKHLKTLITATEAEPVLVMSAGGDSFDTCDIATHFYEQIGCKRLIVTRVDIARRLGSILVAADSIGLQLSNVSITPHLVDGLSELNANSLADLILSKQQGVLS